MRIQIQVGLIVLLTLAAAPPVAAHPTFSEASVVNSASFTPPELPGGAVARGSIFTVFGSQLGPQQGVQATSFPLPLRMSGVSIEVSQPGAETVFPIPLFAIDGQLNAIMPSDAPLGNAALVVIFDDADGRANSPPFAFVSSKPDSASSPSTPLVAATPSPTTSTLKRTSRSTPRSKASAPASS